MINIIHVGIANALDLTDCVLSRLHSHTSTAAPPLRTLHNKTDTNMQKWLDSEETNAVIDPMAMQFCARKAASVN